MLTSPCFAGCGVAPALRIDAAHRAVDRATEPYYVLHTLLPVSPGWLTWRSFVDGLTILGGQCAESLHSEQSGLSLARITLEKIRLSTAVGWVGGKPATPRFDRDVRIVAITSTRTAPKEPAATAEETLSCERPARWSARERTAVGEALYQFVLVGQQGVGMSRERTSAQLPSIVRLRQPEIRAPATRRSACAAAPRMSDRAGCAGR